MSNKNYNNDDDNAYSPRGSSKRAVKEAKGIPPSPKAKYVEKTVEKVECFVPTPGQKQMHNTMRANTITLVDSVAGTGKTAGVLWLYVKEYLANPNLQIYVIRTPVEVGSDKIGFLPNDLSQKCEPHFASAKEILERFLGKEKVAADLGKRIHFKIPNYMLGATLDNALVLIDESQQLQPLILKLLLERIGKNCKVVVAGCSEQIYTTDKNRNGLADCISRFFKAESDSEGEWLVAKYPDVGFHRFSIDEVMRSEIVKTVIRAYKGVGGMA